MRRFFAIAAVGGLVLAGGVFAGSAYAQYEERYDDEYEYEYEYEDDGPHIAMFAELDVYGRWYNVSAYGWVWRPYVRSGWRPYFHGHWAWTNHGWMWIGYEPFAWAAYHYGNWTYHPRMGWIWVPGYDWAPCRVQWIIYDNYVCWAPIPPGHVHIGYPWSRNTINVWISVRADYFTEPDVGRHVARPRFKADYAQRTARNDAPDVRYVERYKGRSVSKVDVEVMKSREGEHEVTRVKLPPEQSWLRERNRVPVQTKVKYEATRPKEHPKSRQVEQPSKTRSKQPAKTPSKQPPKQRSKDSRESQKDGAKRKG